MTPSTTSRKRSLVPRAKTPLGVPWSEPEDVAPLVVLLAVLDAARMVSGTPFAATGGDSAHPHELMTETGDGHSRGWSLTFAGRDRDVDPVLQADEPHGDAHGGAEHREHAGCRCRSSARRRRTPAPSSAGMA